MMSEESSTHNYRQHFSHLSTTFGSNVGYGYYIHWNNGGDSISVTGCATPHEAYDRAIEFATNSGWTRPKWWQFWRWNDSNPKPPFKQERN